MRWWQIILALAAAGLLLLGGSYLYWRADGSVGTPQDFKDRVADTGLDVDWSNAGPRGGDGLVETECGPTQVEVSDFNGELWLTTADRRQPLSTATIEAIVSCTES